MEDAIKVVKLRPREIDELRPLLTCEGCEGKVDRLGTVYVEWTRDTVHLPGAISWARCSSCIEAFNEANKTRQLAESGSYNPRIRYEDMRGGAFEACRTTTGPRAESPP
jgi:hypothetical protein